MAARVDGQGWPEGVGRLVLREVDSTMAEAARRAGELEAPTWILAGRQTAARGRRGRVWREPAGNFAATLVMHPEGGPAQAALRSFVAALALRDACVGAGTAPERLALKWPNDVLLDGGKLAGILLERIGETLLVGIGVNLAGVPEAADLEARAVPPVALGPATGATIAPAAFLDLLAPAFAHWEARFAAEGFVPIRSAWLEDAARLGAPVTARMGGAEVAGRFETVDEAGHLVLDTATGRRAIAAGDIHFPEPI